MTLEEWQSRYEAASRELADMATGVIPVDEAREEVLFTELDVLEGIESCEAS